MTLLSQPNSDQYPTAMQNIGGKNENVYDPLLQYNVSQLQISLKSQHIEALIFC